jgi:hypothetical protein
MDLMTEGEQFRFHKIAGLTGLIIYIVGISPGEYPLLDQQFQNNRLLYFLSYRKPRGNASKTVFNRPLSRFQPNVEGRDSKSQRTFYSFFTRYVQ